MHELPDAWPKPSHRAQFGLRRTARAGLGFSALLVACTVTLGLLTPSPASAQSMTPLTSQNVKRSPEAANSDKPWAINYEDCVDNVEYTFNIAFSGVTTDLNLAVFAGSGGSGYDCSDASERLASGSDCRTLYNKAVGTTRQLKLKAQELVSGAGAEGCEEDISDRTLNLYFALVNSDGNAPEGVSNRSSCSGWCSKWSEIEIDLRGPSQPASVTAGVGENMLVVNWSAAANKDINSYRLYCDPAPGKTSTSTVSFRPLADGQAGAMSAGGSQADTGTTTGQAGSASSTGSVGDGSAGSEEGAAGAGTATVAECGAGVLIPGERPNEQYRCGTVQGATAVRGNAEELSNGVKYAVAVAAVDEVGNVGDLSQVACATPHSLDDFFEVYRRAGGKAGGGFCAATGQHRSGSLAFAMGALLVAAVWRQRRGQSS